MTDLLTRRQREVLRVFVDAGGAKRAAPELGIRPASVLRCLERARSRSSSASTYALVEEATRRGEL